MPRRKSPTGWCSERHIVRRGCDSERKSQRSPTRRRSMKSTKPAVRRGRGSGRSPRRHSRMRYSPIAYRTRAKTAHEEASSTESESASSGTESSSDDTEDESSSSESSSDDIPPPLTIGDPERIQMESPHASIPEVEHPLHEELSQPHRLAAMDREASVAMNELLQHLEADDRMRMNPLPQRLDAVDQLLHRIEANEPHDVGRLRMDVDQTTPPPSIQPSLKTKVIQQVKKSIRILLDRRTWCAPRLHTLPQPITLATTPLHVITLTEIPHEAETSLSFTRGTECKVCMDHLIEVVCKPCGHALMCKACSLSTKKCPICRYAISPCLRQSNVLL